MKSKNIKSFITSLTVIGAAMLLALPLNAARGGNGSGGFAGECPQGLVPGTRNTQDCTRSLDGTGSQSRNGSTEKGSKGGNGNSNGTRQAACDGSGSGSGNRYGGGNGQGTGDPENCPNNRP